MLEARIEELTAAVIALTKTMQGNVLVAGLGHFAGGNVEQTKGLPADQVQEKAEVPNEKPQDSPKSKPTSDTSKPSSPESVAVTYDDVKKVTNAVSAKLGREKAIAGLARFGVQSATKLSEEQWPEYVAYMTRVAAGELDPEAGE